MEKNVLNRGGGLGGDTGLRRGDITTEAEELRRSCASSRKIDQESGVSEGDFMTDPAIHLKTSYLI